MPSRSGWAELAAIDERLLAGDESLAEADALLDHRMELIQALASTSVDPHALSELEARNRRLTEWLLHVRRVAVIEAAGVEQHLRFLESAGETENRGTRIEAIG